MSLLRNKFRKEQGITDQVATTRPLIEMTEYIKYLESKHKSHAIKVKTIRDKYYDSCGLGDVIGEDEPEEVKERFLGESMVCGFVEDDFSPLYLTSIIGMIDNCEGELRDVLLAYVV